VSLGAATCSIATLYVPRTGRRCFRSSALRGLAIASPEQHDPRAATDRCVVSFIAAVWGLNPVGRFASPDSVPYGTAGAPAVRADWRVVGWPQKQREPPRHALCAVGMRFSHVARSRMPRAVDGVLPGLTAVRPATAFLTGAAVADASNSEAPHGARAVHHFGELI
jgi:hypothetical protein